ncbi:MAG: RNA polymerase sigma factor, partial [Fimbriimonadales bacterium]
MLHLWTRLSIYNPKLAPFKAWVSRVVINFTYNLMRNHNKVMRHELPESDLAVADFAEESPPFFESAADPAPDPMDQAADRERLERILVCARETLTSDEYLVWLQQVIYGASYQEIAALMERNEAWARQTMLRARQKLAAVARGEDPSEERRAMRNGLTVGELCDWYLEHARSGRILGRRRR